MFLLVSTGFCIAVINALFILLFDAVGKLPVGVSALVGAVGELPTTVPIIDGNALVSAVVRFVPFNAALVPTFATEDATEAAVFN